MFNILTRKFPRCLIDIPQFAYRRGHRRIRTFKMEKYPCLPEWSIPAYRDPFDYKLQSKEQVREQQVLYQDNVQATLINKFYPTGEHRTWDNLDIRHAAASMKIEIHTLGLAPLQRERLIYLLGNRYKKGSSSFKITCKRYSSYSENFAKLAEISKELIVEAMRAPQEFSNLKRNPYLRDKWKVNKLGRTKEERIECIKKHKQWMKDKLEKDHLERLGLKKPEEPEDPIQERLKQKKIRFDIEMKEKYDRRGIKLAVPLEDVPVASNYVNIRDAGEDFKEV